MELNVGCSGMIIASLHLLNVLNMFKRSDKEKLGEEYERMLKKNQIISPSICPLFFICGRTVYEMKDITISNICWPVNREKENQRKEKTEDCVVADYL